MNGVIRAIAIAVLVIDILMVESVSLTVLIPVGIVASLVAGATVYKQYLDEVREEKRHYLR